MSRKIRYSVGDRFGSLCIIDREIIGNRLRWICRCDCGNITYVRTENLKSNIKCKNCFHTKKDEHYSWKGYKEISGSFFGKILKSSKERNIKCVISIENVWEKYLLQNYRCAYSGVNVDFGSCASVDRIDSRLGYTINNIEIVHKTVNRLKWIFTKEKFLNLVKDIIEKPNDGQYIDRKCQNHSRWKGFGDLGYDYWRELKEKAKRRNLIFDITINDGWNRFIQQNCRCYFSNQILTFSSITNKKTASLDRIDSTIGYTLPNIRWVHKDINISKSNIDDQQFMYWINLIYDYSIRNH